MLISNGDQALAIQTRYDISHDNTLSGTGTESSPLGLSNETLLFSATSGTSACTLSEPISNFDRLVVYTQSINANNYYRNEICDLSNGVFDIIYPYGNNQPNIVFCKLSANNTNLIALSANSICFTSYGSTPTYGANVSAHLNTIRKVIGINRKEEA